MAIDYSALKFPKGPSRYERKDAKRKAEDAALRAAHAAVDKRDKGKCRICGKPANLGGTGVLEQGHRHHVQYRSKGGMDTTDNLVLLCPKCHAAIHAGKVRLSGDADAEQGLLLERATAAGFKPERWI